MDYTKKTVAELRTICREKGIRGFSGKKKKEIVGMILGTAPAGAPAREQTTTLHGHLSLLRNGRDGYGICRAGHRA
jgi:hypothetical protein